jgi:peptide/nickel transport system substrate-binding protein
VLEAFDGYWRKTPSVKRLVMRSIPDGATRLAALKRGEVDIVYYITGELAEELQRTPGLSLTKVYTAPFWLYFPEQWDEKSPWHDVRVRRAASLAIDRKTINEALTFGYSKLTGNAFVPEFFEFYWQPPAPVYDLKMAKELLAAAGYSKGIDAGQYFCDAAFANLGETIVNNLREAGIRVALRPIERAAFFKSYSERSYNKGLVMGGSAAFGNAATRLEAFAVKGGSYAYGSYPEIDELFQKQAVELDHAKREVLLHQIQQRVDERVIAAPIWQLAGLGGIGPRVGEAGIGLIAGYPWTSPYEDLTIKGM